MTILRSNLWPVAAYATMALWLVSGHVLGLTEAEFLLLLPLNGVAHYTTALAMAAVGSAWLGRRKSMLLIVSAMVVWEIFEFWWFGVLLGNVLHDTRLFDYWTDTMSDLVLGTAGMLTGTYFKE